MRVHEIGLGDGLLDVLSQPSTSSAIERVKQALAVENNLALLGLNGSIVDRSQQRLCLALDRLDRNPCCLQLFERNLAVNQPVRKIQLVYDGCVMPTRIRGLYVRHLVERASFLQVLSMVVAVMALMPWPGVITQVRHRFVDAVVGAGFSGTGLDMSVLVPEHHTLGHIVALGKPGNVVV